MLAGMVVAMQLREILWWVAKCAGGGVISYAAPRLLIGSGIPVDIWAMNVGAFLHVHLTLEAARWAITLLAGLLLYGVALYFSRNAPSQRSESTKAARKPKAIPNWKVAVASATVSAFFVVAILKVYQGIWLGAYTGENSKLFNARMEFFAISTIVPHADSVGQTVFGISNTGILAAQHYRNAGGYVVVDKKLTLTEIDALFTRLIDGVRSSSTSDTREIAPGSIGRYIVPSDHNATGRRFDESTWDDVKNGRAFLYVMAVLAFSDSSIPQNTWWASERCVFYTKGGDILTCEAHDRIALMR
jgi:hypothetical protein